jgi:hypothetical protein
MKKKVIIALSAIGVVAIGAALYVYMTFFGGTDFSKNVPKNAVFVMKVDVMGMGKKVNMKEAGESKVFRKEVMENLKSSQKEMIETLMANPLKSGIQLGSNPTLFFYNHSKSESEPVLGFIFGISDKKNFNNFLEAMAKDVSIKDPDQDGYYKAILNNNENAVLYFNDKVGLILADVDRKGLTLKRVRDEIIGLESSNSILTNEEYATVNKQTNDMMVYFNGTETIKALELNKNDPSESLKKSIKAYPYGMTLNFNEDAIAVKMLVSKSSDANPAAVYKDGGFSDAELKNIDPKGNPLAYFTANMDLKKLLELVNDQAAVYQGSSNLFGEIDNLAAQLNIPKDDLLGMLDGKMSLSFSGMKSGTTADSSMVYQPSVPLINGWAHLGKKEAATKMLDYFVSTGSLVNKDGIYMENTPFRAPSLFVAIKGNDLFLSTQQESIQNKIQGKDWETLKEDYGKKEVATKSATLYADLRYSSYESMIKSNIGANQLLDIDKFKNILSSFKSISITGNKNEAEMVIQFTEKKTNSLQRIIELLQEAYRLTS